MLRKYIKKAFQGKYALGQFNFSTLDQMKSIIKASDNLKSPVILGTSNKEADFFGMEEASLMVSFYKRKGKKVFLNLDHCTSLEKIKKAVDLGYDMVHFDGSKLEVKDNIKETIKVLKYAHRKKVLVEGELGLIPGSSKSYQGKALIKKDFVSIQDISNFIEKTKVDLLALSVGNLHGVYSSKPKINFNLLKQVSRKRIPLVFHGGSGTDDNDIRKAIKLGVVKVNINTELRIAWKESLKKELAKNVFAPYDLLEKSQRNVILKTEEKIKLFKSDNKR
jgi:ketose-bisphosphate aldolase